MPRFSYALSAALAVAALTHVTIATAAPIVIDDFTVNQGSFGGFGAGSGFNLLFNDNDPGSYGGFTSRQLVSLYSVGSGNQVSFSGTASAIGSGSLTLGQAKGGTPLITGTSPLSETRVTYSGTAVDLTGGGSNNALRVAFSGVTISGLAPVASLIVSNGLVTGTYSGSLLPTTTVGGTTADVLFSSFSDSSVFSGATVLTFQIGNYAFAGQSRSTQYTLTGVSAVSVVPEPATCAMVLAGLACGGFSMWRRRKQACRHQPT